MLGKRIAALIMLVTLVTGAAAVATAPTYVNTLRLSRDGSFTVLTIEGNRQLRYAHQSVEAKQGKPFRIVIDCLAARHGLAQKTFTDLPNSIVTDIRTSQYAVTPEEVVRVVLDLKEESIYRVEADGSTISVRISDQTSHPFAQWVSPASKPKTTPKKDTPVPTMAQKKTTTNAVPSAVAKAETPKTPKVSSTNLQPTAKNPETKKPNTDINQTGFGLYVKTPPPHDQAFAHLDPIVKPADNEPVTPTKAEKPTVKAESTPIVAKTPVEKKQLAVAQKTETAAKPKVTEKLITDSIQKAKLFASVDPGTKKSPEPGMNTRKNEKPAPPAKVKTREGAAASPKSTTAEVQPKVTKPTASADPATDEKVNEIKTSKYRRMTAKEAEMKASEVVQFPRRMVIKYKKTNSRDPFESLIVAEADRKRNANLNIVPNIETLDLVGILKPQSGKDAALMEDRDGIGYILRPGDRVRNGYVAQVDDYAVYFQINEYGWGRTVVKKMDKNN